MTNEAKHPFAAAEFRKALQTWYRKNGRDLPWRRARDPYAIMVSEFMLQQTQVATVLPYYIEWLRRFPDFSHLARASENDVLHAWQGLGYYSRARNLHAAAKIVMAKHRGLLPRAPGEIAALPGAGRYTANAIATFAFDQPLPIVEANIARVVARIFDLRAPINTAAGRDALWKKAASLLPKRRARHHNGALMDLGALLCNSRAPKCGQCPVRKFCRARDPISLPVKKARAPLLRLTENHRFHFSRDRVLLEKSTKRWRGLWILPPLETARANRKPLHVSEFPFTHHRVSLAVFRCHDARPTRDRERKWFRIESVAAIPMPSPHRRALAHLLARRSQKLCSKFSHA